MLADYYQVETAPDFQTFDFVSVGPKGRIIKEVRYREIGVEDFYNLRLTALCALGVNLRFTFFSDDPACPLGGGARLSSAE